MQERIEDTMKTSMPHDQALAICLDKIEILRPRCDRIEPAGSLRRECPMVGDIEIVAIPKPALDMFGLPIPLTADHALNYVDWEELGELIKNGPKQKQVELHEGIMLDLFIVTPPAQWGPIFTIRTGPKEYGHSLVTSKQQRTRDGRLGLCPSNLRFEAGSIWKGNTMLWTPEEADVFKVLGLPWIEPEQRR
jgi:DNA polymerase (family 10)